MTRGLTIKGYWFFMALIESVTRGPGVRVYRIAGELTRPSVRSRSVTGDGVLCTLARPLYWPCNFN